AHEGVPAEIGRADDAQAGEREEPGEKDRALLHGDEGAGAAVAAVAEPHDRRAGAWIGHLAVGIEMERAGADRRRVAIGRADVDDEALPGLDMLAAGQVHRRGRAAIELSDHWLEP